MLDVKVNIVIGISEIVSFIVPVATELLNRLPVSLKSSDVIVGLAYFNLVLIR